MDPSLQLPLEAIQLRGISWAQLLEPSKKGQWWLASSSGSSAGGMHATSASLLPGSTLGPADVVDAELADKVLQLAAAQRMNTDVRRSIFCVIMTAEDYVDAFEKILRLGLTGKQVSLAECKKYMPLGLLR